MPISREFFFPPLTAAGRRSAIVRRQCIRSSDEHLSEICRPRRARGEDGRGQDPSPISVRNSSSLFPISPLAAAKPR